MNTRIIVVSGSPGSGKTSLVCKLGDELGVPVLSKDLFKDAMMDVAPPGNRQESSQLGHLAWAAFYAAVDSLNGTVPCLLLEANFHRDFAKRELLPRLRQGDAWNLHCEADRETIVQRIRARKDDPARHQGHFDQEAIPDLLRLLDQDAYRLDFPGISSLAVDTTNGYRPGFPAILTAMATFSFP